jgi:hypothetical protein
MEVLLSSPQRTVRERRRRTISLTAEATSEDKDGVSRQIAMICDSRLCSRSPSSITAAATASAIGAGAIGAVERHASIRRTRRIAVRIAV